MLGEKVSRHGLSTTGNMNKVGDQMGLKHHNTGYSKKSIVPVKKDIAENKQLSTYEPVHIYGNKNKKKKSHLEK